MSRTDNERVLRIESSAHEDEMEKIELKSLEYVSLRFRSVSKTQTMRNARHAAPARASRARRSPHRATTMLRRLARVASARATLEVRENNRPPASDSCAREGRRRRVEDGVKGDATPRETIARRATDDGTTTQRTYATAKGAAATADVKVRNVLRAMMARDDAVTARRAREGDSGRRRRGFERWRVGGLTGERNVSCV